MDRRTLIATGIGLVGMSASRALAQTVESAPLPPATGADSSSAPPPPAPSDSGGNLPHPASPTYPAQQSDSYDKDEIVHAASDFLGVTAEAAGAAIERIFAQNGRPTAYIAGTEAAAAITIGLRYGKGLLYMKRAGTTSVFWQGPSVGFDLRANASRVFTLCYNLQYPDAIFQRFPGVEGSAYFIGGLGVNYQRANDITLAPIRAGVGLGAGANVGYLAYTRHRNWIPL